MKTRREFLECCFAAGAAATLSASAPSGAFPRTLSLNTDWTFHQTSITLPHCAVPLSWHNWQPATWEKVWTYRRRFSVPRSFAGSRVFLHFEGAMTSAAPVINGHPLPPHAGGYLPFEYEITKLLREENQLEVAVDARWQNVPPEGSPKGPRSIDYLEPGGMWGSVELRAFPAVFIKDVFARPERVLNSDRLIELRCTLDTSEEMTQPLRLDAELEQNGRVLARGAASGRFGKSAGENEATLVLAGLHKLRLWDIDHPSLCNIKVTLSAGQTPLHEYRLRTGIRDARFEIDGFFLNGKRVQIFGLNRHEIYPYTGHAMPPRVQRRDAEILRCEFNCNMVRCSHYPQSKAFLDACDELGLMVWEEPPGWQYIGDPAWQELALRDVREMVKRDRNHPAIVIWGVRINESPNDPELYSKTKAAAKLLDGTRQTSGSMTRASTENWLQDVFAFDDYHATPDGDVSLIPPVDNVPFFFSEAVGQFNYPARHGFNLIYRRAGDLSTQERQAIFHAQAHDRAAGNPRYCGLIAWCAFEYASLMNDYQGVKYPGIADVFRIPKLGASFYLAQTDPATRPVIEPNFYWDFGPASPAGPGPQAAIFSNCERLELFIDGKPYATLQPDRANFPHLRYPPFFAELALTHSHHPELRIDAYIGTRLALSRSFSSDPAQDQLLLHADDRELVADGSDATRLVFRVVDKFGAPRAFAAGAVKLYVTGPGVIVGDNPFDLSESGGAGAVWIRTLPGRAGKIRIQAQHPLGQKSVEISVKAGEQ
jgi:beta-galactosidase